MSNNISLPSVEEVNKWSPDDVITFLGSNKNELFLRDQDIKTIKDNWLPGSAFLELSQDELQGYAPYIQKFILFASEWVAEKVMDKLERNYSQQLRNFVSASSSENEYNSIMQTVKNINGFSFLNLKLKKG
ncbi:5943_t:CDS:2 [Funneliformis geosporum]|uniref:5943_t:CDS:1 n=1 Tax=Funneliformis geosporum TaxID=1117311 RepID=A0A9W4WJE6_9GLOM|nr:5943_t:CDS:2 [Funneliformis geosporum]